MDELNIKKTLSILLLFSIIAVIVYIVSAYTTQTDTTYRMYQNTLDFKVREYQIY